MRSEQFHPKGKKNAPIVVDEASRLTVLGTEPVNVFQIDDDGNKIKLLTQGVNFKVKLNDVNEILLESKGDFNSVIEGPDKLDNTPVEVAMEKPLTQTQELKMWLQNENNTQQLANHQLTWEEFKDLGDLDDGDEFYSQYNQNMTKYEMQAEAIRQEMNPLRGNPISNQIDKQEAQKHEGNTAGNVVTEPQGSTNTVDNGENGQTDNKTE